MHRIRIVPYKLGSVGARELAQELGCLRVSPDSTTFRQRRHHILINWGGSRLPRWVTNQSIILNHPSKVAITSNKLEAFRKYTRMPVPVESFEMPDSTESKDVAKRWIQDGHKVYCRKVLTGHSGAGIVVATTVDELVNAPLYTKQFKAKWEYRIHVFRGEVIDEVKKGRLRDTTLDVLGRDIRTHEHGYVFIRTGITVPQEVREAALAATAFYGLDFSAVDVGYHPDRGACVYELNTSPGNTGTTTRRYAQAIRELLN